MFIKKHDTKDFYKFFWGFIAFAAITVPFLGGRIIDNSDSPFFVLIIGVAAGITVYLKSRIDLINFKSIFNLFSRQNIVSVINSSVTICNERHGDQGEYFLGEFLVVDRKTKDLISSIRSHTFEDKVKDLEGTAITFLDRLSYSQGFAGATYLEAEKILENMRDEAQWELFLLSKNTRFPTIFNATPGIKDLLRYSNEQFNLIHDGLDVKSVLTCPVVHFKKKWHNKYEIPVIIGILVYLSNLPMDGKGEGNVFSSLPFYRANVIKQALFIARYPKIYEKIGKKNRMES